MSEGAQRRLAAIVSSDVVGNTRLMGADEAGFRPSADVVTLKFCERGTEVVLWLPLAAEARGDAA